MKQRKNQPRDREEGAAATLSVRIQPRASKNEIVVQSDGSLKIRLTAPPVDGAANEALIAFLAKVLRVSRSQIEILSGHTSREKRVRIGGISRDDAERILNAGGK